MMFVPEFARSVLAFVVVLGVLVFVHELGHYLAARWRGIHAEVFSIGFGRAITQWTDRHGTVWKLAWIPLGGYVRMHGQERPEEAAPEVRASWMPGRTFHEKSVLSRAIVIAAGPFANFLLAVVLFAGLFATIGMQVSTTTIGEVLADSAAAKAGLQTGDKVQAIDGTPVARFEDLQRMVMASPERPLRVQVLRNGVEQTLDVTPSARQSGGKSVGVLGVRSGASETRVLGPFAALKQGVVQTYDVTAQTLAGLGGMISRGENTDQIGGPLRIAQLSGQVAQLGVASLISFIALLSVNLALINLFPIPILDGGHLVFLAIEGVRGRPLPVRAQEYGYRGGLALLLTLFVFATWNDLTHLNVVRWIASLFS